MTDVYYEVTVYSGLIIATGLFSISECFIINFILGASLIAMYIVHLGKDSVTNVYNVAVVVLFNLVDSKLHCSKEIDSFNNIMQVDEKCNRISQFVDRLLPKHVFFA